MLEEMQKEKRRKGKTEKKTANKNKKRQKEFKKTRRRKKIISARGLRPPIELLMSATKPKAYGVELKSGSDAVLTSLQFIQHRVF